MSATREKTTAKKLHLATKKQQFKTQKKNQKNTEYSSGFVLDMGEWEQICNRSRSNLYDTIDDVVVSSSKKLNQSTEDVYVMQIILVQKIYDFLDCGEDNRCHVLRNKSEPNRIILTRSPNGYSISRPKTSRNKYIKITLSDMIPQKLHTQTVCKTISHEKKGNSGSVIEFYLPDDHVKFV